MFVRDAQGRFLLASASYAALIKHDLDSLLGRTVDVVFTAAEASAINAKDRQVISKRQPIKGESSVVIMVSRGTI